MEDAHYLVLTTCPDRDSARRVAAALIENKYAACVNMLPGVASIYQWKGRTEEAEEILLLVKTVGDRYQDVEACILATHPYELPEVIAIRIERGLSSYLGWVSESCQ